MVAKKARRRKPATDQHAVNRAVLKVLEAHERNATASGELATLGNLV